VKRGIGVLWVVLVAASLVACRPVATQPQAPTATPSPPASPTPPYSYTPTLTPLSFPTPTPTPSPTPPPTPTSVWPPPLTPPYTPTGDLATGRIRGRLFFPSEFIPPLAVYAVATDGSRFYRVDTQMVPPGEPSYEIPIVKPGTYHVYGYPALLPSPGKEGAGGGVERESPFGGAYSYLAACEAGHFPPPPEGCWENPQHDPAPVEVWAGQAVEEINVYDWYGPSLPPPPDDTSAWPTYTDEQLAYRIRYPPHWEVRSDRQGETTFGPTYPPSPPPYQGRGSPGEGFASVRVTNGDPEELADELIGSLPPGEVVSREWLPFAGHQGLHLVLDLPEGQFAWWFVLRYELVYVVHAVTDSGLGSFDQMVETFAFLDSPQPVPTDTSAPEPTLPPSPMPTSDAPPGDEPTPAPDCAANPAPPHSTIAGRRLVAFYGVPIGRGLGILGAHDVQTTLALLREQAEAYSQLDPCVEVIPIFHTVVTIADAHPGEDGDYNHRLSPETLRSWLDTAAAEGVWVVLDIQAARSPLATELSVVEFYLYEPNVHLAIDPEFIVGEGEIPGTNLGRIDGETINAVQAWLNSIAENTGERKILVIHQFDDRMVVNKDAIQDYPLVDLVWDADGYGGPGAKTGDYNQYRGEPGFEYGGFKLFYDLDTPLMTPGQVMALDPPPAVIIYQ